MDAAEMKGEDLFQLMVEANKAARQPILGSHRKLTMSEAVELSGKNIETVRRYIRQGLIINYGTDDKAHEVLVDESELMEAIRVQHKPIEKTALAKKIAKKVSNKTAA